MKTRNHSTMVILITMIASFFTLTTSVSAGSEWRMATSAAGTAGYACTMGLSSLVNKYTKYNLESVPTPGSTASVRMFGKKEADFAYQSGWGLSEIYEKLGPFENIALPRNPMQGLYYASFEIMAMTKADRADINSYKDFIGKKVYPNHAATGWHDLCKLTLGKIGIYQKMEIRFMDQLQVADALKIGNLDVAIGYSTNLGELSVSWIKNIDAMMKIKIISPNTEEQRQISALKYPGVFYGERMSYKALTPENVEFAKNANPNGVWLWGAYQGWHPGADMPTQVMYDMYKVWMENAKEVANVNAYLAYWAKDPVGMQLKAIGAAPNIPVHPGVARYLKEKGVWNNSWAIGKLDAGVK
jgi:uncharacterized protein